MSEPEEQEELKESKKVGMKDESEEHPSFSKKAVEKIVNDHLKMDDDYYKHKEGKGGGGGSPCKFVKREGCLEDE